MIRTIALLLVALSLVAQSATAEMTSRRLSSANNAFGFDMLSKLREAEPDANTLFSPASIAMALAMTTNGAAGETRTAMLNTLRLDGADLDDVNQAYRAQHEALEDAGDVTLNIANSIWANENVRFHASFLDRVAGAYDAEITSLPFNLATVGRMNRWVLDKTHGKIDRIISEIDSSDVMVLINAVYFQGMWKAKFDRSNTTDRPFTTADETVKDVPMMSRQADFLYLPHDDFQAVLLPYEGGDIAMAVFLPSKDSSLAEFCSTLRRGTWDRWMAQFRKREGSLRMPRSETEYATELSDALVALGMAPAFNPSTANFSEMAIRGLGPQYIDEVKHKCYIKVDEEGTEAAAATSVKIRSLGYGPTEPFRMEVNRPYFCAIVDRKSGTILFMGAIVDPEA